MTPDTAEALFRTEVPGLRRRLARRYGPFVADDLISEAFAKVLTQPEHPDRTDSVATLGRAVRDAGRDYWRSRAGEVQYHDEVDHPDDSGRSFLPEALATFPRDFDEALRGLSEDERDAYILTELRGLAHWEAAGLLDVDRSTVTRRAEDARIHLRKELS